MTKVLAGFAAVIISIVLNGFALKVLWGWFVADVFGIKHLSIPEALGVALVVEFLTHQNHEDKRGFGEKIIYMIFQPLIMLLIGGIFHLFM